MDYTWLSYKILCILTNYSFKKGYFQDTIRFLIKFQKPRWLKFLQRLWPYNFSPDICILRGPSVEKITCEVVLWQWSQFETKPWIRTKNRRKKIYIWKNMGLFSLTFNPMQGSVSNWDLLSHNYFMHNFFIVLAISNQNIWKNIRS